jgi:hypothetical protein
MADQRSAARAPYPGRVEGAFDTITMVISPDELSWLMAALSRIEEAEAQGPIDRVRAVVARR